MIDEPDHVLAALERLDRRTGRDMTRLVEPVAGVEGMRGSYGRILDLVTEGGTRPSELADGAAITKQAIGARVRELIERGWLRSVPDPTDGRAVLLFRTDEGERIRTAARTAIAALEAEWAAEVGAERWATFRAVLDELGSLNSG